MPFRPHENYRNLGGGGRGGGIDGGCIVDTFSTLIKLFFIATSHKTTEVSNGPLFVFFSKLSVNRARLKPSTIDCPLLLCGQVVQMELTFGQRGRGEGDG